MPNYDKQIGDAFDTLFLKSNEHTMEIGRLGFPDGSGYTIDVPGRPKEKYVSRGIKGEDGIITAIDKVGVANVAWQQVRIRREYGRNVIREAEQYSGTGGGVDTFLELGDVVPTGWDDGDVPIWSAALGKLAPGVITGGGGGGPTYLAGNGITIFGSTISTKHKPNYGINADSSGLYMLLNATGGLLVNSSGLAIASPGTISVGSSNTTSATDHTHAIFAASDVTAPPHSELLKSASDGTLKLSGLTIRGGDLLMDGAGFAGPRQILATNDLRLAPTGNLIIDPAAGMIVLYGDGQESKTQTFTQTIAGVTGFRLYDQAAPANYMRLVIGSIFADELTVTHFTADETRVTRGEEYWTYSYGTIAENTPPLPADEATFDVWFEEAPDLGNFALFLPNHWLRLNTIDWSIGIDIQKIFFQVVDAGVNHYIQRRAAVGTTPSAQQWRLRRKQGGRTGYVVKKGEGMVDFGLPATVTSPLPGDGNVHISALNKNGGPFIETQTFESVVSDIPQFLIRTRMGNLNGLVDYTGPAWGFAAGNNLGTHPTAGFSGLTADQAQGLRLFNTDIELREGSLIAMKVSKTYGISLLNDDVAHFHNLRNIAWYDSLANLATATATAKISSSGLSNDIRLDQDVYGVTKAAIFLTANGSNGSDKALIAVKGGSWEGVPGGWIDLASEYVTNIALNPHFRVGGDAGAKATSNLHVYYNNSAVNEVGGVLIQQAGSTGDAMLHFQYGTGTTAFTMGIDHQDGKLYISAGMTLHAPFLIFNPVTGSTTINGVPLTGSPVTGLIAGPGIMLTGSEVAVNNTVVRTDRLITAGDGLAGGGDLSANRTLSVNSSVARSVTTLTPHGALSGGGNLGGNMVLDLLLQPNSGLLQSTAGLAINSSLAGAGLTMSALKVLSVNTTDFVGTSVMVTGADGLLGGGTLNDDVTLTVDWSMVVPTTRQILTVGALLGSRTNLAADLTLSLNLAAVSGLNQAAGLAINDALAGNGLSMSGSKVMSINTSIVVTDPSTIVRSTYHIDTPAGGGVQGGGTLTTPLSLTVDTTVVRTSQNIFTNAGSGLTGGGPLVGDLTLSVLLKATNPGLDMSSGLSVLLGSTPGLTLTGGLSILLATPNSGLNLTGGLNINDGLAGAGLTMTGKIMAVGAGNGIAVAADSVAVDQAYAFNWTGNHSWGSLTTSTFNGNVILNKDGTFNTGVFQFNTNPKISANLDFIGGVTRSITATNQLSITTAAGDLFLDPFGDVVVPNAQGIKTSTFQDVPTGIDGMSFFDRGSNKRHLTIGSMKMDELFARVFVADTVRLDRGEEYWSKSFGVVETTFPLPTIGATADVYFEDAPGLAAAPLFAVGDYLLLRTIDITSSLSVVKVWMIVSNGGAGGWVSRDATNRRQLWRLQRIKGGSDGLLMKKGLTALDVGTTGQGQIYLSALSQDGGPFIQTGVFTSLVASEPAFTYYTRMGNLKNTAGFGGTDIYGFAAGNDLSLSPTGSPPFSGVTSTQNGIKLYNTDLEFYVTGTKALFIDDGRGISFKYRTVSTPEYMIRWLVDVDTADVYNESRLYAFRQGIDTYMRMEQISTVGSSQLTISAAKQLSGSTTMYLTDTYFTLNSGSPSVSQIHMEGARISLGAAWNSLPRSTVHIYEGQGVGNESISGLTIEQNNASDAVARFLISNSVGGAIITAYSMGLDNSQGDYFKISGGSILGTNDFVTLDTAGKFGIGRLPVSNLDVLGETFSNTLRTGSLQTSTIAGVIPQYQSMGQITFPAKLKQGDRLIIVLAIASNGGALWTGTGYDASGNFIYTEANVYGGGSREIEYTVPAAGLASIMFGPDRVTNSSTSITVYAYPGYHRIEGSLEVSKRVGIGTSSPGYPLDVVGRGRIQGSGGVSGGIWLTDSGATDKSFVGRDASGYTGIFTLSGSGWLLAATDAGKVGIGTTVPDSLLTVAKSTGAVRFVVGEVDGSDTNGRLAIVWDAGGHTASINGYRAGLYRPVYIDGIDLTLNAFCGGKVGVGATPSAKLHVYSTTPPTGGSGDMTNSLDQVMTVEHVGSSSHYPRILHKSGNSGIAAVYNYETAKSVYWGEPGDTGNYYFRGRTLIAEVGINFGQTTINYYLESTWTPVVSGSTSAPSIGYGFRYGHYVRQNKNVSIKGGVNVSSASGGSGVATISLPFTSWATGDQVVSVYYYSGAANVMAIGYIQANSSVMILSSAAGTVGLLANNSTVYFSGQYNIA